MREDSYIFCVKITSQVIMDVPLTNTVIFSVPKFYIWYYYTLLVCFSLQPLVVLRSMALCLTSVDHSVPGPVPTRISRWM